ncbi:MAG: hypothetical protein ACK5GD_04795 [Planctomycetota bacterium]
MATHTELQVPIESVPIGSRVPTKNPNRFEVDPQPEPDQATWAKLSITVERSDGGIVDAEIIRPRSWILRNGLCAGRGCARGVEIPGSEIITGTTIHPVWSVDRQVWVPLAELAEGEDQDSLER